MTFLLRGRRCSVWPTCPIPMHSRRRLTHRSRTSPQSTPRAATGMTSCIFTWTSTPRCVVSYVVVYCDDVLTRSSCSQIHNTGLFFPFHRFYVNAVESAMKEFCGYTGAFPYWDWSIGKRIAYVLTMHLADEVVTRCARRGEQPSVSRVES